MSYKSRSGAIGKGTVGQAKRGAYRRRAKLLLSGTMLALTVGFIVVLVGVFYDGHSDGTATAKPTDVPTEMPMPPAQPGPARPWEASIEVSTFSQANAVNRNLLTTIPVIGWSGVGPDVSMALYHNSASVDSEFDPAEHTGWTLGPGWTTSFSSQLVVDGDKATVIYDNGRQDVYTWAGFFWQPPPGVYDYLIDDFYHYDVVHKGGSYHRFTRGGRLDEIGDGLGNSLSLTYAADPYGMRLAMVTDAAGRELHFVRNSTGRLTDIVDPAEEGEASLGYIDDREWTLTYDAEGRVDCITDPEGGKIDLTYDDDGRILTITDTYKTGDPINTYTYQYNYQQDPEQFDQDAIWRVTDPKNWTQQFSTTTDGNYEVYTTYTDRRGEDWLYCSRRENMSVYPDNGPISYIENPLAQRDTFRWDTSRNMTFYRDALNHTWVYTYNQNGNVASITDPNSNTRSWTWTGQSLLASATDALDNQTEFHYDLPGYSTLLTSIVEPDDGVGDPEDPEERTTTLEYYIAPPAEYICQPPDECKHGQLKKVTDAEGVVTKFDYDQWGQLAMYAEGWIGDPETGWPVYRATMVTDSGSRVAYSHTYGPGEDKAMANCGRTWYWPLNGGKRVSCCEVPVPKSGATVPPGFPDIPSEAPDIALPPLAMTSSDVQYTGMGKLKQMEISVTLDLDGLNPIESRTFELQYDELGALSSHELEFQEHGQTGDIIRTFNYVQDLPNGRFYRFGPDDVTTEIQLDAVNRVESVVRRTETVPSVTLMSADYTYYANGLVDTVTYGNGTSIHYDYDLANRVLDIDHRNTYGSTMRRLVYSYYDNDLPSGVTEYTVAGYVASTGFGYDNRGRLINEHRIGENAYQLTYAYDQVGNRTMMTRTDAVVDQRVVYEYDTADPDTYGSDNNRLERYVTCDVSVPGSVCEFADPPLANAISTTYYYYNPVGNVTRVVTEAVDPEPGQPKYSATRMVYGRNQTAVSYVMGETWEADGSGYTITYGREFRYDGARQRYLNRELNLVDLANGTIKEQLNGDTRWSEYDGDDVYADFTIDVNDDVIVETWYEPGVARSSMPSDPAGTQYYHTNHLGTTRLMSNDSGWPVDESVYSAFGELVDGTNHRYGYVGAHGYQTHNDFPFMHLGHRYYDPATGRFLQRDPIGINGGLNVYGYVLNQPTAGVDPLGLNNVASCQDGCDTWFPASACGGRTALEDCYMSCLNKDWPPAPAPQPPPPDFTPWPGPCPPVSPPRPPGPSPSGSWNGKAALALVVLFLLVLAISLRKSSVMGRAGAA